RAPRRPQPARKLAWRPPARPATISRPARTLKNTRIQKTTRNLPVMPELPATSSAGKARAQALQTPTAVEGRPTSIVTYHSQGRVVIIGEEDAGLAVARRLGDAVPCTVLVPSEARPEPGTRDGRVVVRGGRPEVEGRLGRFAVTLATPDGAVSLSEAAGMAGSFFDLVLDLSVPALLQHEIPPVGYYAAGAGEAALNRALAEIPEMSGEFEKPKYFN